jgi:hypothetical protein
MKVSERRAKLVGMDAAVRVEHVGGILDAFAAAQGWNTEQVLEVLRQAAVVEQAAAVIDVTPVHISLSE